MPFDQFPANRLSEPQSPIDVAARPLPKSPVSSSLDNVVPQIIVRSPRVRAGKLCSVTQKDFFVRCAQRATARARCFRGAECYGARADFSVARSRKGRSGYTAIILAAVSEIGRA